MSGDKERCDLKLVAADTSQLGNLVRNLMSGDKVVRHNAEAFISCMRIKAEISVVSHRHLVELGNPGNDQIHLSDYVYRPLRGCESRVADRS